MLKGGEYKKQDRNNLKVFKYAAGEGWIRSDETVMLKSEVLGGVQGEGHIVCRREQRLSGLFTLCIGTAATHIQGTVDGTGR
jgi:hypothetical protein